MNLIELISNTDEFLMQSIASNLVATYFVLFAIIFLESGVILCPFLPGDGLLFSVGVVATMTPLNIYIIIPLLILAAIVGFLFNYQMGKFFGKWIIRKKISFIEKSYQKTNIFISEHGGKAVIISRFFPVVRTYLPFVAGAVYMDYSIFFRQTILGGILWVCLFIGAGYFLGEIQWVRENYGLIFLGLVGITLLPLFLQGLRKIVKMVTTNFLK